MKPVTIPRRMASLAAGLALAVGGVVGGAGAASAAGVAAAWQPSVNVMPQATGPALPALAMGAAGDVALVFQDGDHLFAALKSPGTPLAAPVDLTPGSSGGSPSVGVDAEGGVLAAWSSSNGSGVRPYVVRAAQRQPGASAFDAPLELSAQGADAGFPQVAVNAAGDAAVSWHQTTDGGASFDVMVALRPAGGAFGSAVTVASGLPGTTPLTSAAIDDDGVVTIVWSESGDIRVATCPPAGSCALDTLDSSFTDLQPSVAVAPSGTALVVWQARSGATSSVGAYAAMRPAGGGSFETPARVSTPGQRAATVRATFTAGGDALVAWRYNATIPLVLVGQARRPAGGSWQPAEVASTTGAVTNSLALAAGGSDGSSFLAYVDTGDLLGGGPSALPVGRWVDGQPDGAGLHPLLSPDYFPSEVVLGADGAGNAAAGWIQWGDEMQVRLAGFDATPPVIERFDVPATAVAGKPLTLAAEAPDVWSETSYAWVVRRDGSGEEVALTGATPSYDFPVAGNYTVELIASDMDGRAAPPASAHVAVEVQPGDPPRPPVEEPRAPAEEPRAAAEEPRAPVAEPRAPATRPRPRTRPRLRVVRAPRTVVGKGGRLRVACRLSTRTLRGCTVRVTGRRVATVAPGLAGARAAAQRVLAEGRVTLSRPASGAVVDVRLGAELREHVAGALGGVPVTVEIVARTRDGRTLKTTARTVLLAARQQVVTPIGAFGADDGALTDAGDRFLRGVARELRGASAIRCTGHTASLFPGDVTGYAWRLGLARARTACAALRAYGVRVPLTADTRGKRDPLQSNATEPGREANRRVTLTIVRRAG